MSRKRYVSTDISVDTRVRQLAEQSEFAALVYTWMIPHAGDDATIVADSDELLMLVVPGFRWRKAADITEAVKLMIELGLLERVGDRLRFPERAFYKYQAYVKPERRTAQPAPDSENFQEVPGNAQEPAPFRAMETRKFRASGTHSSSHSQTHSPSETAAPASASAEALVEAWYEALGVESQSLTRSIRKRELVIAGQLVDAGATPVEARAFIEWCRAGPYRPVPSDLRVYEQKRAQFLAGLEPLQNAPPGRNGAVRDREEFSEGVLV